MKILLLVAGGRAGSDFFHGLLDNHSQILQFPGLLKVNNLELIINSKTQREVATNFIKAYPQYFNSKKEKFERWNKLGVNRNKHFTVDKKKFINSYLLLSNSAKSNKVEILINLHRAYSRARNEDYKRKKILFIHTHILSWTKIFIKMFNLKKFELIHTIRHPIASISSPIKTWLNFKNGYGFFPKDLFFQLDLAVNCINDLKKINKVHIIQLERLHKQNTEVMKDFCKKFKIKYEISLSKSTKNGLKWWGDSASKRWISGVNKKFSIKINENYFYKRDLQYIEYLASDIIKTYGYKNLYPKKKIYFNFLPMKCEIMVWRNTIKHLFSYGFRWKHLLSIPIFYSLRLLLINKFSIRINISKLEKYPKQTIKTYKSII